MTRGTTTVLPNAITGPPVKTGTAGNHRARVAERTDGIEAAMVTTGAGMPPMPQRVGIFRGIRARVFGWYALMLAVALAFSSLLLFEMFTFYAHSNVEEDLVEEIFDFEAALAARPPGQTPQEAAYAFLRAWPAADDESLIVAFGDESPRAGGPVGVEPVLEALMGGPAPSLTSVTTSAGEARVLVSPIQAGGRRIGVAIAVHVLKDDRVFLLRGLGLVAAVSALALVLASGLAWLSTGRILRPINDMVRVADEIVRQDDLGKRIPDPGQPDEVGRLTRGFNRMLDRLEGAFRRERQFISEASHELRTPITICRGHLEVLDPEARPEEVRETLSLVVDELGRMGRIVEDMTTLARVDDPEFIRPVALPLDDFIAEIAAKAHPLLDGRLQIHGPDHPREVARADPQRLTQALINLLQNAAKHTPDGTPVELRVVKEPDAWRFEVVDEGGGLPPGTEEGVFQPFRRIRPERPGRGLGLAIVRGIAEAHKGAAGVINRPGVGATFWIRLPR